MQDSSAAGASQDSGQGQSATDSPAPLAHSNQPRSTEEEARLLAEYRLVRALDRVIESTVNIPDLLNGVLDELRAAFQCDRVYLLREIADDPSHYYIPYESCNPRFPGAAVRNHRVKRDLSRPSVLPDLLAAGVPLEIARPQ